MVHEIEKILDLKDLPGEKISKDIFPIFEAASADLYPKVPDREFDYLFTNWGDKQPEEPFVDAEKSMNSPVVDAKIKKFKDNKQYRALGMGQGSSSKAEDRAIVKHESNQVDKIKKSIIQITDLSESDRDLVGKIEQHPNTERLKKKGWEKWNEADWRDARRKVRVKKAQENVKELIDLKHKVVGESVLLRSQALLEMKFLDVLFKNAMKSKHVDDEKDESKSEVFKKLDHICREIFKEFKITLSDKKEHEEDEVLWIGYKSNMRDKCAIHAHFVKGSKICLFSLWDKEEYRLLLMLSEGNLREEHLLIGTAKSRLKSWMRDKNGN